MDEIVLAIGTICVRHDGGLTELAPFLDFAIGAARDRLRPDLGLERRVVD